MVCSMPTPIKYVALDKKVTWRVRFRLQGKSCSETFNTKLEATRFCNDIANRDVAYAIRMLDEDQKSQTSKLDVIAEAFFAWKENRVRSDRTVADYRQMYQKWIKPTFGDRPAGNIDQSDIQKWVDSMSKELSVKSVLDRYIILSSIFKYAIAPSRRLVDFNPCTGTELPKRRKGQPKGLKPAEWAALYSALSTIDKDAADLAQFMLATGMRWSEATALAIYDVWEEKGSMHVTVSHVIRRNAAGQDERVEDTKSEASQRQIVIDSSTAEMVNRRIASAGPNGLVFTTAAGSQWHYSNFKVRSWNLAVELARLDRKPTPHWLRHTHVAWMLMSGANLPELQSRIGHESISTTINIYGRMITDVSPKVLEGFASMRGGKAIEN
jgi:integrase